MAQNAGGRVLAAVVGVPAWTAMTLTGGWTNHGGANVNAQYRLWQLTNEVEIVGNIVAGTLTNGTAIATLPFTPASTQEVGVIIDNTSGSAGGVSPRLTVTTGGALQIFNIPTGTTIISIQPGTVFSLDA